MAPLIANNASQGAGRWPQLIACRRMAGANLPRDLAPSLIGSTCGRWALLLFPRTDLRSAGPGHTSGMADCPAVRRSLTRTHEEHRMCGFLKAALLGLRRIRKSSPIYLNLSCSRLLSASGIE